MRLLEPFDATSGGPGTGRRLLERLRTGPTSIRHHRRLMGASAVVHTRVLGFV